MSSPSDWFARYNAMSSIGTNPGKLCTSKLPFQGSITTTVPNLKKQMILYHSVQVILTNAITIEYTFNMLFRLKEFKNY